MITQELITALFLGLIGGVIPGPVLAAIFTEILHAGLKRSLRIIFTALAIESLVAILSLLIISAANFNESIFRALSFGGALVLFWIASSIWKINTIDTGENKIFSLWKLTLLILSNGVLWIYWITICIPKAMYVKQNLILGDFLFMGLVQIGWLISTIAIAFTFSQFRQKLSKPKIIRILFKVFAIMFIYFSLDMLIDSIHYFSNL